MTLRCEVFSGGKNRNPDTSVSHDQQEPASRKPVWDYMLTSATHSAVRFRSEARGTSTVSTVRPCLLAS